MDFAGKKELVKRAQTALGIDVDGIAGFRTWLAIGNFVGVDTKDKPTFQIIPLVQKELGLVADSKDGPRTWQAIVDVLEAEKPAEVVEKRGKYKETIKLSPQTNGKYASKITPKAIILHSTEGNYEGSIDWTSRIINPDTGKRLYASYHCIIKRNGERTITNPDDGRAYHAGASEFKGKKNLNSWSIGLAWERNTYNEPLQEEAIESAIEYIIPRMKKWNIPIEMVTDHRTIATPKGRKSDIKPSELERFLVRLKEVLANS